VFYAVQNTTPTLRRKLVKKKMSATAHFRKLSRSSEANGDLQIDARSRLDTDSRPRLETTDSKSRLEDGHALLIAENSRLKSRIKEAENELDQKDNALLQAQIAMKEYSSSLKQAESALQKKDSSLKETENALRDARIQIEKLRQEMETVRQGTIDYVLQHMSEFSKTRSTDV
jgi:chromosome segregation ATPase